MASKYGLPYKGSKNTIAEWVVEQLPSAKVLVDLFCGGCAVTHAALLTGKWERVIANDIHADVPQLFLDAIEGRYTPQNEKRWISREDFSRLKDVDAYVRICWSFGNDGETYLYAMELEPFKRRLHELIFAETVEARLAAWSGFVREFDRLNADVERLGAEARKLCEETGVEMRIKGDGSIDAKRTKADVLRVLSADIREYLRDALKKSGRTAADVDRLLGTSGIAGHYFGASQWKLPTAEAYAKMQTIIPELTVPWAELNESLQSLQRLQRLQSLEISGKDYREVEIPEDAVIYCDIPYECTKDCYGVQFDRAEFLDWADAQTAPVIISEYNIDDERFAVLSEREKVQMIAGAKHQKKVMERLYFPKKQLEMIRDRIGGQMDIFGEILA